MSSASYEQGAVEAERRMRARGEAEDAIRAFLAARARLTAGEQALLPSDELEPASDVPRLEELPPGEAGEALGQVAMVKLNGGLASTMGLRRPKSLLTAREGRTFLEVIVGRVQALRARHQIPLPLVLMNSQATREATLAALSELGDVAGPAGLPLDFEQAMEPKLEERTLAPVEWPADRELEWCPPGHGDVYGALRRSGMLAALLGAGCRYALISNSDNLGAALDERIVAHMHQRQIPFLMEVVQGTESDRKGGHLARRRSDARLVLRESAQVPPADEDSFRDYRRWRYYNTNNLWVELPALAALLDERDGVLDLPLIVNRKTVDPRDPGSPPVIQLESAMGAAIESFPGAQLLQVPRTRFIPVKTTDDLLVLRSDVYRLGGEMELEMVAQRPYVELDKRFFGLLEEFERRFPAGAPSLREAERLLVRGDVTFGAGVVVRGTAELDVPEPARIADGTVLGDR
jgi:UTP--glucose-1-phosphate uridylyltransferase